MHILQYQQAYSQMGCSFHVIIMWLLIHLSPSMSPYWKRPRVRDIRNSILPDSSSQRFSLLGSLICYSSLSLFHLLPKFWQAIVIRRRNSMFLQQLPSDQSMSQAAMNLLPLLPCRCRSETGVTSKLIRSGFREILKNQDKFPPKGCREDYW